MEITTQQENSLRIRLKELREKKAILQENKANIIAQLDVVNQEILDIKDGLE
jgi:hypothetical protein